MSATAEHPASAHAEFGGGACAVAWSAAAQARAEPGRLRRGREYARAERVGEVALHPGRVTATVGGSRSGGYLAQVRLPLLADAAWERLLDALAAEPAHVAAFAGGRVNGRPEDGSWLLRAAREADVALLPEPAELAWRCTCPDGAHPCKHAVALGCCTARLLDADPRTLLLLRGRPAAEVGDALARRTAALTAREPRVPAAGVPAHEALATAIRRPLPPVEPLPPRPSRVPPPVDGEGAPDVRALGFLATAAAVRAYELLDASGAPGGASECGTECDTEGAVEPAVVWRDAVQLASAHPELTGRGAFTPRFAALAAAVGTDAPGLSRAAAAWRQGGALGLRLAEEVWEPPAGDFDRARGQLAAAGLPRLTIDHNHLTHHERGVQLRFGPDGAWYPYRAGPDDRWWPEGPAGHDPAAALSALLAGE